MRNPIPQPWRVPVALITLSLVPFMATANRLIWLSSADAASDPAMARFDGAWGMLATHILCGSVFLLLSALQFSPEFRTSHRMWHRVFGKIAMTAGVIAGLSGVGLVVSYPPSELATPLMDTLRVIFGAALAAAIFVALRAIRQGDVASHRAWMIRAFALAVAGSTQAVVIGLWLALIGDLTPESATALIAFGFALNIAFAEWCISAPQHPNPLPKSQRIIT